jgi:hypothetical protein
MEVYSAPEREAILARMESVSRVFYAGAVQTNCHPFIEFCGLMNEYIEICRDTHEAGIDFTQASAHGDQMLKFAPHHLAYLREKLNCIYGPSIASAGVSNG